MGRVLLVARLAARDLRRRPGEAALLLLAIAAACTTLTLGLVLHGVIDKPYDNTRRATNGPDAVTVVFPRSERPGARVDPASVKALTNARGVVAHSGPYPLASVVLEANGRTVAAQAEGRDAAPAAVDQPKEVVDVAPIATLAPTQEIESVDALAKHLHVAAQVELSTIPLYLYSAYSIKTKGYSQWAPAQGALRTLIGVAIEEMLHLALVRNMMIAIGRGDQIRFYDPEFMPRFPSYMLNRKPDLLLELRALSTDHVDSFIELESPDPTPVGVELLEGDPGEYTSLGAFYRKIEKGFKDLCDQGKIDWSKREVEKQYLRGFWNQFGAGKPIRIETFDDVRTALEIIIEQGEGSTEDHQTTPKRPDKPVPGFEEYTHYWKFVRIKERIEGIGAGNAEEDYDFDIDSEDATWPVVENPQIADFEDDERIHSLMNLFNASYCYMLCILDELFDSPTTDVEKVPVRGTDRVELHSRRYALERNCIASMQGVLYPVAELLVRTPLVDGRHAGPSFEYYEFGGVPGRSKKAELVELCRRAMEFFPELGGDDSVQRQISLLIDLD